MISTAAGDGSQRKGKYKTKKINGVFVKIRNDFVDAHVVNCSP